MNSTKQNQVLNYLGTVDQTTSKMIYHHMPFGYYRNESKHFCELLSRMVRSGLIVRLKKGVYKLGPGRCKTVNDTATIDLFTN